MGSILSHLSPEMAAAAAILVVGIGYVQISKQPATSAESTTTTHAQIGKKGKKKKSTPQPEKQSATSQQDLPAHPTLPKGIPGEFESESVQQDAGELSSKTRKKKKKKGKSAGKNVEVSSHGDHDSDHSAPEPPSSSQPKRQPANLSKSVTSIDTDGSWTRVESRRQKAKLGSSSTTEGQPSVDLATSDAGVTTSVTTGTSSPIAEDEASFELATERKTVAEKLVPKPRKTSVDDMLETPDYPELARVMRVQPRANEKPAQGFSWADYEDVRVEEGGNTGNDADGEDDGWGVVQGRGRSKPDRKPTLQTHTQKAPETLTKRQRQNAQKRDASKAAKADAESERLAVLSKHKRELEKAKMAEQFSTKEKKTSGGMKAVVDDQGKLVWE